MREGLVGWLKLELVRRHVRSGGFASMVVGVVEAAGLQFALVWGF